MRPRIKWTVIVGSVAVVVFFTPIVVTAFLSRGLHGYFYAGHCACGYAEFTYVREDGLYSYNPQHRYTKRTYTLRSNESGWDLVRTNGTVAYQLRIQNDEVFTSPRFMTKTNWYRMERVYNIWRVWVPRVLPD